MQFVLKYRFFMCIVLVIVASGCAGREHPRSDNDDIEVQTSKIDPFEEYNRSIYRFNTNLDRYFLKPVAKTYRKITPKPIETGIYNIFNNLQQPINMVNSLLQGKLNYAGISAGRFVINSTIGVLGFFDVAGKLDIPNHKEDFGQTLATWGVPSGPYFVLPLFGSRYLRHSVGMIPDFILGSSYSISDNSVRYGLLAVNIIQRRARFLDADDLLALQLDPYIFIRESYLQLREAELKDMKGSVNHEDEFNDEFDDDFDDEFDEIDKDDI